MKERPIIFSAAMVRAILEDRKTQTRRVVKPQPEGFWGSIDHAYQGGVLQCVVFGEEGCAHDKYIACPYGMPSDQLWVRETFLHARAEYEYCVSSSIPYLEAQTIYAADVPGGVKGAGFTPAIFMPKHLSRITLEITEVRVQRLQEISEEDARAEGCEPSKITVEDIADVIVSDAAPYIKDLARILGPGQFTSKHEFSKLWDSINAKNHPWSSDPWVWCISFRRLP